MINIKIKTVKRGSLPYNRVGDWHWDGGRLLIFVSETADERFEWLIAIHEIVEAYLCKMSGVTEEAIDRFDKEHGGKYVAGGPGYFEHQTATAIEMLLSSATKTSWERYEKEIADS